MVRLAKLTEFRAKILFAFAGAYLASWALILVAIYVALDDQKENEHHQLRTEFQQQFESLVQQRTNTLSLLLDVLAQRQELHGHYVLQDHQYLKEIFKGDFEKLQQKLNVTHFYIGDAQGRQIVRLHAPDKYGDTAIRYQKVAENNGQKTTSSISLGAMGSITHRVVKPIYPHGELEGFMELGEEIDVLWAEIAKLYDASVFIMVEKNRLQKERWQLGKEIFRWPGNWSDLETHVVSGGSNYREMFDGSLPVLFENSLITGHGETKYRGENFVYDNLPLFDTNRGEVGSVFIIYPQGVVTGEFWNNLKRASIASALAMLIGMALCYTFLRPVAIAMESKQSELERQISLHTHDLLEAKEIAEQERNNAILASKTKSDFLSNMSHELRTPLNSIIGFSSIVMNDEFDDGISDRYKSYLNDINHAGTHLLEIINDILDVSRIEAGKINLRLQKINVQDTLAECHRMVNVRATEKGIAIIQEECDPSLQLSADITRFKQIILNLLTNAVKFTHAPGSVRMSAIQINETEIEFSVQDDGMGVPKEDIPHILKRFGQGSTNVLRKQQEEGTGLGLTLVQDLIKLHHGTFDFQSTEGTGTTVTFTLPISPAQSETSDMI